MPLTGPIATAEHIKRKWRPMRQRPTGAAKATVAGQLLTFWAIFRPTNDLNIDYGGRRAGMRRSALPNTNGPLGLANSLELDRTM